MTLSLAEVEHIAKLAHLALSDEEKVRYREQLSAILDYAQRLQGLDTEAIAPTATILPVHSVMRPDEPRPSMPRDELLLNAPEAEDGMFQVPPVLE
jgi:aspartyl-tRNA(Asn)/glutamyl-tRNA(Gln) amidotransferase subunit C